MPARQARLEEGRGVRPDQRSEIPDLEAVAQVGLVDAVALHRLAPGEPRERRLHRLSRLRPEIDQDLLDHRLHVFRGDEGRLEVDLGELRLAVGAQVFVAEAARDLEVAVVAGHHQQLLVDLRGLRQRVELARMNPARHQVVTRAFGSGLGEDRRLDLQELQLGERAPGTLQQPMAQDEIAGQLRAPQVEHPVLEPQLFGGEFLTLLPSDRDRRRLRRSHDLEGLHPDLDVPGGERRVAGRFRTQFHGAAHQHDAFRSHFTRPT